MRRVRWEEPYDLLLAAVVGLAALVVYIKTLTPTVPFWDSGEFIATSHILGIPHPPGTPLYVLLGRVLSLFPIGSIAERVNMLSAIPSAIAVAITYLVTARVLAGCGGAFARGEEWPPRPSAIARLGAAVAGLVMAFSDTYWVNAIEAEVYALSSMVMVGSVYLMLKWRDMRHLDAETAARSSNIVVLVFYLLAISIAFHMGVFIVFLPLVLFFLADYYKSPGDARFVLTAILFVVLSFAMGFGLRQLAVSGAIILVVMLLNWEIAGGRNVLSLLLSIALLTLSAYLIAELGPLFGLLLAVLLAAVIFWGGGRTLLRNNIGTWAAIVFVLGLSVHIFLLIRAGLDPSINEADPSTLGNFWKVLSRDQYKPGPPWIRRGDFEAAFITHFWRYWRIQYEMGIRALWAIPFILGIGGAVMNYVRSRRSFILLGFIMFVTSIGLIWHLNFRADEVRDRDYFFVSLFHFFAIWIGMGAAGMLYLLRESLEPGRLRQGVLTAAGTALLLIPVGQLQAGWFTHDRSRFWVARDYAYNLLQPLAKDAILFTNGDNDTFPLWYLQEVEGIRKDVRVANLSLLNTDWYILQLKHLEPKVPISFNDEEIHELGEMTPFMDQNDRIWTVKDVAVQEIIRANAWKKPLYIAVTVPELMGLDDRLQMEGLAWRVYPQPPTEKVDHEKLRKNLEEVFMWRGLLDDQGHLDTSVYRDSNAMKLVQNYAAAYARLGESYRDLATRARREGRTEDAEALSRKAIASLERMQMFREGPSYAGLYTGALYHSMGRYDQADSVYTVVLNEIRDTNDPDKQDLLPELYYRRGEARLAARNYEGAVTDFGSLIQFAPQYWESWDGLIRTYVAMGRPQEALDLVNDYLRTNPRDKDALAMKGRLSQLVWPDSGAAPGGR